jgi:dephospho-CoA kinase
LAAGSTKTIIGLTGNIATGKTVVRRMLEQLGAYTIDADGLTHRAMAKGAPGYEPIVAAFGKWVLDANEEINRKRLGKVVFRDSDALSQLESIIHPLVREAIELLIRRSTRPVVVIEAIKLLEGDLRSRCDSIWVTHSPPPVQVERLMTQRAMSREEAEERVAAQGPQSDKIALADVVIRNTGTYDDVWRQVEEAWKTVVPTERAPEAGPTAASQAGSLSVKRGRPQDAAVIASLLNRLRGNGSMITADDVMAQFGDKAYMLLQSNKQLVGLAGWQVENLVVRTTDLHIAPGVDVQQALQALLSEIEAVSADLQCEASLVFPRAPLGTDLRVWEDLGYQVRVPDDLSVQAWADAALESMPANAMMLFKQLRSERILRPI